MRYFFHVSVDGSTFKPDRGRVLATPELAILRAAVVAAELTRAAEYRRGYVVRAVDEAGTEIARCQAWPTQQTTPAVVAPSSVPPIKPPPPTRGPNDPPKLTPREHEVLTWIALGKSAWEIAQILGISTRTVEEHVRGATRKLNAANRTQAVAIAVRDGLISF